MNILTLTYDKIVGQHQAKNGLGYVSKLNVTVSKNIMEGK
jgi:hypothetical protein